MKRRHIPPFLLLPLLLSACASSNGPALLAAREMIAGVRDATPCCKVVAEAFHDAPAFASTTSAFNKSSPHFDFGDGLAPFLAFRLPSDTRVIEMQGPLHLIGWVYGGDGVARYVDVKALFFDGDYRALPANSLALSQASSSWGRSLFSYVAVPPGAKFVAFSTDPKVNGTHEIGVIRRGIGAELTSASTEFFGWGGIMPNGYRVTNYGTVVLRALPNG